MSLSTTYLGLRLSSPLMPGASPLVDDLDMVKRLVDAGASAIVMHSLFEEQVAGEHYADVYHRHIYEDSSFEASSYFPHGKEFALGPDQYLEQIRRIKKAVNVPVIGSLNGTSLSGWIRYAALMQDAGADALELNVYYVPTDPSETGSDVERRVVGLARAVRETVAIPLAVKLSPFYSSLPHLAMQLDAAGVNAFILFNRFYQPEIEIDQLETVPRLHLSDASELPLRLRWLGILAGHTRADLAVSGGIETGRGAIQAIMAGASAVQMVSALLRHGPEHLRTVRREMIEWMQEHEYHTIREMLGSMNLTRCPDPAALERANYMRVLQGVRVNGASVSSLY